MHDKIWAAGRLVYMGDMTGKKFIETVIDTLDQDQLKHLVSELYEEADPASCSITTLKFLLDLADKYETITTIVDRKKIEIMLQRLKAGEVFTWEVPLWDIV